MDHQLPIVATCSPGLEPFLADELTALGFAAIQPTRSAVRFRGDWPAVWRANYWLRTANRVLIEIASFPAATDEELYAGAAGLIPQRGRSQGRSPGDRRNPAAGRTADRGSGRPPMRSGAGVMGRPAFRASGPAIHLGNVTLEDLLDPGRTFAVSATSSRSRLRDTRWIALKVKDAIADAQRARFGRRADVDARQPDVPLRVWLHDDRATVLLDSSREPLDRRGYRRVSGAAPLREPLAAAVVLASGWDGAGPVVDPMCGTGTLLIEAAWIALGRAPGALRESWVFERWPGFDARGFAAVRDEGGHRLAAGLRQAADIDRGSRHEAAGLEGTELAAGLSGDGRTAALRLHGRDLSTAAIRAARLNLEAAGLSAMADLEVADGFALEPPATPGLVVTNPAYGERLETDDQEWRRIGDLLKQRYAGWSCAVIAGEPSFGKHLGLRPRRRIPVRTGPLDARILVLDLYRGSRRLEETG